MKTTIITLFFVFFAMVNTYSQDTLVLLSGRTITGEITFVKENEILLVSKGRLFNNEQNFYNDEIYSVSRGITNTVLYTQDSAAGKIFSVDQMAAFIEGQKDARKNYHAPLATIGGFATGVTGGFFGFWGITIPASYVFIAGIKTPKLETQNQMPENIKVISKIPEAKQYGLKYIVIDNEIYEESVVPYYKYGYEIAAKDKKIKNAIGGSIAGFVALVVTSYILVAR
jgi:hypothetical protein